MSLIVTFRSNGDDEFIVSDIPREKFSTEEFKNSGTDYLMALAVRNEFEHKGGAYYLEKPCDEFTADFVINDNLTHGYDLITAFFAENLEFIA